MVELPDIEHVIVPPVRDLGDGFMVRRALPSAKKRMVGPMIFFDQMGPATFNAGDGLDVRPHPHIGLSTVTYLFEGEILHRDSVGSVQHIRPGAVNWMTAGSGIVHSERTGDEVRASGGGLYGIQTWVALPTALEETSPTFSHHPAETIPEIEGEGLTLRLIAGATDGIRSPVPAVSDMVYGDLQLAGGARYAFPAEHIERAVYVVAGNISVAGQDGSFGEHELVVFRPGAEIIITANGPTRLMIVGGEPFPEKRYIYWNFVSSSPERLEQAKSDWRERRFAEVPGEVEFIPLPPEPAAKVRYP
ncbi:hypothetical protein SAMN06295912_101216 [Sphingomonas laterariae]|uniref:Pirin n=1 Tax=Edaphosphingomonas laterariae TaxID=861865 RepID=A0A239BL30_9SPHN|nr:pirin family protein [Sphingomonas laterariae]SNS08078.1 hypothetical protein SAMN06295912_101216 [Sphingomonas laterariae]